MLTKTLLLTALLSGTSIMLETTPDLGRVGGPGEVVEVVKAHSVDCYNITFRGDERAEVIVHGDGDTDLDLFIYDEHGNLIACDDDCTDFCIVRWVPRWTGRFRIEVVNLGSVSNLYQLTTN